MAFIGVRLRTEEEISADVAEEMTEQLPPVGNFLGS